MAEYEDAVRAHYESCWGKADKTLRVGEGPLWELPPDYGVLVFPPRVRIKKSGKASARLWTYATCGMSQPGDERRVEVFIESPQETLRVVEILNATAHYHRTGKPLGWEHTVNFGMPWLPDSNCDHGLISLPYLDGPALENATILGQSVRILWLIPITRTEREYKVQNGIEALEKLFEQAKFDFSNPSRPSVLEA
jgi:hypothetical protein